MQIFKTKQHIKTDRDVHQTIWKTAKQLKMLLGKDAAPYMKEMQKQDRVKVVDGVTKFAWKNDLSEQRFDQVNAKEIKLSTETAGAGGASGDVHASAPSATGSHDVVASPVTEVFTKICSLGSADMKSLHAALTNFLNRPV